MFWKAESIVQVVLGFDGPCLIIFFSGCANYLCLMNRHYVILCCHGTLCHSVFVHLLPSSKERVAGDSDLFLFYKWSTYFNARLV